MSNHIKLSEAPGLCQYIVLSPTQARIAHVHFIYTDAHTEDEINADFNWDASRDWDSLTNCCRESKREGSCTGCGRMTRVSDGSSVTVALKLAMAMAIVLP